LQVIFAAGRSLLLSQKEDTFCFEDAFFSFMQYWLLPKQVTVKTKKFVSFSKRTPPPSSFHPPVWTLRQRKCFFVLCF